MFVSIFNQKLIRKIFVAETVHIGNAVANKVVCLGIVEFAEGFFVRQTGLFRKQFYDTGIFHLQYGGIGLHGYNCFDD